jgi:sugar lactone lactonase YvrE
MTIAVPTVERVPDIELAFGEGLAWDGELGRLYFVDAVPRRIHWLEPDSAKRGAVEVPATPTVVRLTDLPGVLVVSLPDGLYTLDTADGTTSLLASLPDADAPRMNDAVIDDRGRFVTGHLFFGPGDDDVCGAYWSFEQSTGWQKLDSGKGNTNGPCFSPDGATFYVADTSFEKLYRFDYDAGDGTLRNGRVFANYRGLDGVPDGAKVDSDGYLWSVAFGGSQLVRFAPDGSVDRTVALPTNRPTDLVFAGPDRDVAYVTTVGVSLGDVDSVGPGAGGLLRIVGLGATGLPENRFRLADDDGPSSAQSR